ncbi:MAG: UDP-glucose--hexose-1-phosphate uridylyltransferase [Armatimonadota bacterium]|nr:UDP-glucose--hexose-1-phosphate uridylyltransferase [Armatimonadota bacterium]
MAVLNLAQQPHRRYNPLMREWILVSPHRALRPWQGQEEKTGGEERPSYDPNCYLCPGNARAGGAHRNPLYTGTYVFDNDFPALLPRATEPDGTAADLPPVDRPAVSPSSLMMARGERGICRVVCFSPRHDLTLPQMERSAIRAVVDTWAEEFQALGSRPFIRHVQIFENKGEMMGCSNPHPHGQIWAQESIPETPSRELAALSAYREAHGGRCLLCDYLAEETRRGERLVCQNPDFTVLVPFWAVWPFETLVISHRHLGSVCELTGNERDALADILRRLTIRYDNLFETSFPYSMGMHQAPTDGRAHPEAHLHLHFFPPLLRSVKVRKFMVGYEMLGEPQRDITPETSAERLRGESEVRWQPARNPAPGGGV